MKIKRWSYSNLWPHNFGVFFFFIIKNKFMHKIGAADGGFKQMTSIWTNLLDNDVTRDEVIYLTLNYKNDSVMTYPQYMQKFEIFHYSRLIVVEVEQIDPYRLPKPK